METTPCTETNHYAFDNAPRCGAKARTNNYAPCRSPAIRGKSRCRMHGGKGSGAKQGNYNALKHGCTTIEAKRFRLAVKEVLNKGASL